jgi:hypothetical protein
MRWDIKSSANSPADVCAASFLAAINILLSLSASYIQITRNNLGKISNERPILGRDLGLRELLFCGTRWVEGS